MQWSSINLPFLQESWTTYAAAFLLITVELPILLVCKQILEERLELNGILIEKDSDGGDNKIDFNLLEPLISQSVSEEEGGDLMNEGDIIAHIGGSSGSDCGLDERGKEWLKGQVVVDSGRTPWDSSSGGSSTPAFNQAFLDDGGTVEKESSVISAHGMNRTSGKGGSGSSEGSRGVLASVDLTDGPDVLERHSNACFTPPRHENSGASVKTSKFTDVLASMTPSWSKSVSSSFDEREGNEVLLSDRIIDALLCLHVIEEEPIL